MDFSLILSFEEPVKSAGLRRMIVLRDRADDIVV
jgi:hypothetical protein